MAYSSTESTEADDFSNKEQLSSSRANLGRTITAGMPPEAKIGTHLKDAQGDFVQQRVSSARSLEQLATRPHISARQSRAEASIAMFEEDRALLLVRVAQSTIEISVPIALIPTELRLLGQPVFLSLTREDGFTKPLIERRPVHVELTDAEAEALAWLNA